MMAPTTITQALEHFLEAAWHRTAVLNRRMIGLAQTNLKFGFELARAKTLSDVLSLQAGYWQEQWNAFQAEESCGEIFDAHEPRGAEAGEPLSAEASEPPSPDQEPVRPQAKARIVASTVLADAPETLKQKSKPKPMRKLASLDRDAGRKSVKSRVKQAQGRPSSNEAPATERKARVGGRDAVSPSGTGKIQFGMLDGNAVRFTSAEAWALLEGAWKKVPVDEVLSDAVVLSQARFGQLYPEVPELPVSAFRPKGKQNR